MNPISVRGLFLRLRLASHRIGMLRVAAAGFCLLAILSWGWVLPYEVAALAASQGQLARRLRTLASLPAQPPSAAPTPSQRNYRLFQAALGEPRALPQHLRTLFETARERKLVLARGEYKLEYDAASQSDVYRVLIPVSGSYGAIRQFCETALRQMPFASLDEIGFRRDAIGSPVPEARLRFSFYLRHETQENPTPAPAPALDPVPAREAAPASEAGQRTVFLEK